MTLLADPELFRWARNEAGYRIKLDDEDLSLEELRRSAERFGHANHPLNSDVDRERYLDFLRTDPSNKMEDVARLVPLEPLHGVDSNPLGLSSNLFGELAATYDPLGNRLDFDAVVKFANRYGPLTVDLERIADEAGEMWHWLNSAGRLSLAIELWAALDDTSRLRNLKPYVSHYQREGLGRSTLVSNDMADYITGMVARPRQHNRSGVYSVLVALVDQSLWDPNFIGEGVHVRFVLPRDEPDPLPQIRVRADTLIGVIWAQFADAIIQGSRHRRCETCGTAFPVRRGTDRARPRKYCTQSCNMRAWRASVRERRTPKPARRSGRR